MNMNNSRTRKLVATASVSLLLAGGGELHAQNGGEKSALRRFFEQDYLFGDWGGRRTEWREERGVDFEFLYAASVPSSVDGGLRHGSVYQGGLLMMMNLDTEKLGLWSNGSFRASSISIHNGKDFSENYIGDLNKVSLLDFPDTFRLWELFYEHKFLDGRISLKAGQLDIGMDFIVPEYYNAIGQFSFQNQTFFFPTMAFNVYDQPYFPPGEHALASTPYAAPGARLRVDFTPKVYAQVGAYDGNPDRSFHGTDFHLDEDEGALLYFELGYKNNQGAGDTGLPGNFKVGGWYHTDEFFDMYQATFVAFDNYVTANGIPLPPISGGTAPEHEGNYGLYLLADHMLWRERDANDPARQGLVGFFRASYAPPDRNLAQLGIDGGVAYKGLIPGRDWDTFGVALSYLEISEDLRAAQRDINAGLFPFVGADVLPEADYEMVLEMNYKLQLAAWAAVNTSVQRVFHPGGRVVSKTPDAWAIIVQLTLRL